MKVIKKGFENAEFGKDFICKGVGFGKGKGGCGAVLHVVPADVVTYSSSDPDFSDSHWFVCPECGAKTYVTHDMFK